MTYDVRTDIREKLDYTLGDLRDTRVRIEQLKKERDVLEERAAAYQHVLELLEAEPTLPVVTPAA